jgi:hypothetical protein
MYDLEFFNADGTKKSVNQKKGHKLTKKLKPNHEMEDK